MILLHCCPWFRKTTVNQVGTVKQVGRKSTIQTKIDYQFGLPSESIKERYTNGSQDEPMDPYKGRFNPAQQYF